MQVCVDEKEKSKGFGFVCFSTDESAQTAIDKCNGMVLAGSAISVSKHVAKVAAEQSEKEFTNVFVKNIKCESEAELQALFAPFGEVVSVQLGQSHDAIKFGFVNFKTNESAVKVILLACFLYWC